jgi:CBS domain containing-hemolysin-like protein
VAGLTLGVELVLGTLALGLHLVSVALAKALRTYSRSRLEDLCTRRGHPERADLIAHRDEATERAAEALAVLTGLALAALLGATVVQVAPQRAVEAVVGIALAIGAVGHVAAGVVGRVHAEALLDRLWPLASLLRRVMLPFTAVSRRVEALGYKLARRSATAPRPRSVEVEIHTTEQPDEDIVDDLPESSRGVLERVVELAHRDVAGLMTPRSAMIALPASVSAAEAARVFHDSGRSRIPLFGENRDDIVGILHVKDLFAAWVEEDEPQPPSPRKLARPAFCVPETKNANELLNEFRMRRTHQAIVLDEYGGVSGLVTLEDLLEHVVGPIDDEHDVPTPVDPVVPISDSRFELDAALSLEQLNDRLDLHLPTNGDFQTVGGFAFNALGRLPEAGTTFRHNGVEFTVLEVSEHAIRRLRVDLQPSTPPEVDSEVTVGSHDETSGDGT